jgi:hypothetical protein
MRRSSTPEGKKVNIERRIKQIRAQIDGKRAFKSVV